MKIDRQSVIVITGGSRGIGSATAEAFAKKGATVVLAARNQGKMQQVARHLQAMGATVLSVSTDVGRQADCQQLASEVIQTYGKIDVLINNAGYGHYGKVEDLKTEDLDAIFRTNVYGALWCTQAVLPHMKRQGSGHIVHVSSVIGLRAMPWMGAYCMSKFALNALDESLRLEVKPYGVRVTLVCPGLTHTEFQVNAKNDGYTPQMSSQKGMSADRVGRKILRAVEKNQRRVYLTGLGRLLWSLQRISPALVDVLLGHHITTGKVYAEKN